MISLIVAIGENNLIGNGNKLPWYYPEDLKYFKEKQKNEKTIDGRKLENEQNYTRSNCYGKRVER